MSTIDQIKHATERVADLGADELDEIFADWEKFAPTVFEPGEHGQLLIAGVGEFCFAVFEPQRLVVSNTYTKPADTLASRNVVDLKDYKRVRYGNG